LLGEFRGSRHEFVGGNDFRNQPELLRFTGFDEPSSQQQIARTLFSDLPRQENGNNRR